MMSLGRNLHLVQSKHMSCSGRMLLKECTCIHNPSVFLFTGRPVARSHGHTVILRMNTTIHGARGLFSSVAPRPSRRSPDVFTKDKPAYLPISMADRRWSRLSSGNSAASPVLLRKPMTPVLESYFPRLLHAGNSGFFFCHKNATTCPVTFGFSILGRCLEFSTQGHRSSSMGCVLSRGSTASSWLEPPPIH